MAVALAFAGAFGVLGAAPASAEPLVEFLFGWVKKPEMLKPMAKDGPPATHGIILTPATFADLPGWADDDHLAAWKAFVASCKPVLEAARSGNKSGTSRPSAELLQTCELALAAAASGKAQTRAGARQFFETHFKPQRVDQTIKDGLLTGYFEPLIKGSRKPDGSFTTPIYKRPADLENVVAESERGATTQPFTHMRRTAHGLVPHLTREQIERGGLKGQGLELLYFRDPVDVYFMQVQGSGRVELPDGSTVRITYDGKNGYPYTSIGKSLIEANMMDAQSMSLKALAKFLKTDRKRAEDVMWRNKSYVFFRELTGAEAEGAMGVLGISLQAGRSLAVDTACHAIGTPIYVTAPDLTHASASGSGFNRLMVAHDVGSAIKGPERGDIFFGSGERAEKVAGVTKHAGHFFVLTAVGAPAAQVASERP